MSRPPREPDDRLAAWVDGEMSERERDRFEAELRVNPELRAELAEYERTVAATRQALRAPTVPVDLAEAVMARIEAEPAGPVGVVGSNRSYRLVVSVAAAAALLVLAVWLNSLPTTWTVPPATETTVQNEPAAAEADAAAAGEAVDEIGGETGDQRGQNLVGKAKKTGSAGELSSSARAAEREGAIVLPRYGVESETAQDPAAAAEPSRATGERVMTLGTADPRTGATADEIADRKAGPGGARNEGERPEGQRPEGQRPEGQRPEGQRIVEQHKAEEQLARNADKNKYGGNNVGAVAGEKPGGDVGRRDVAPPRGAEAAPQPPESRPPESQPQRGLAERVAADPELAAGKPDAGDAPRTVRSALEHGALGPGATRADPGAEPGAQSGAQSGSQSGSKTGSDDFFLGAGRGGNERTVVTTTLPYLQLVQRDEPAKAARAPAERAGKPASRARPGASAPSPKAGGPAGPGAAGPRTPGPLQRRARAQRADVLQPFVTEQMRGQAGVPLTGGSRQRSELREQQEEAREVVRTIDNLRFEDVTVRFARPGPQPGGGGESAAPVERYWLVEGRQAEVRRMMERIATIARASGYQLRNGEVELPEVANASEPATERGVENEEESAKRLRAAAEAEAERMRIVLRFRPR